MAKAAVTRSIRDDHQKNFLKIFNSLTGKHSRWEIWEDFVTLTAIEISNSTDKVNAPERTKMYQTIVSKYSAKEREGMAEMLGEVIMGMEQNPDQDFLGSLYMMCELGNSHAGQFFTPYDVCRCMAESPFDPKLHPDMEGFISVSDPACGAGATLLAFLNVCKRRNICYHKAINAADGTLITPNGSGTTSGSVKADHINNKLVWSTNITVKKDESDYETEAQIECDSTIKDGAKLWLYNLGFLEYPGDTLEDGNGCWFNNGAAERCFYSGGDWVNSSCGLASFSGYGPRSSTRAGLGFRSAFVKLPTA